MGRNVKPFFHPHNIAVIGASRHPGKVGHEVLRNLKDSGFKGKILPVNPNADEILGFHCIHAIADLDHRTDLAILCVPAPKVLDALRQTAETGCRSAIILSAGFKETGAEGRALEEALSDFISKEGIRVLGPNCLGLVNTSARLNAGFSPVLPDPGPISIISQSGALCVALLDWAKTNQIGLNKVVSIGNKVDINEIDLLTALKVDPDTRVIACYLENITQGEKFLKVAEQTASVKPVIILKVGVTSAGIKAAGSHTGSLAGSDAAYASAFKKAGVIRAGDFEALFDYAEAFAMGQLPKGNRLAILTNAGGPGIMAADAAEGLGFSLVEPSIELKRQLHDLLPAAASTLNPIDVIGDAQPRVFYGAYDRIDKSGEYDAVILVLTPQNMTRPAELAKLLNSTKPRNIPLLTAFLGGQRVEAARSELRRSFIPNYYSPDKAVRALKALLDYSTWKNRPPRVIARVPVNTNRVERVIRRYRRIGESQMNEMDAKTILRAYEFNVLPGMLVQSGEEAAVAADRIGVPVVAKIVSPDVIHKTDVGGVKINLRHPQEVRDACDLMLLRIGKAFPEARITGIYIEKMGEPGREVILGMTRDAQFGPLLMFGLGGIFVEVLKDITFNLAPVTAMEAMDMLKATRSFEMLTGARGQESIDLDTLALSIQKISQMVVQFPEITELDINPFILAPIGKTCYPADARIRLSERRSE